MTRRVIRAAIEILYYIVNEQNISQYIIINVIRCNSE